MSFKNAIKSRKEEIKILEKAKKNATKNDKKHIQSNITKLKKYIKELERKDKPAKG
jgi:hypothetical protein